MRQFPVILQLGAIPYASEGRLCATILVRTFTITYACIYVLHLSISTFSHLSQVILLNYASQVIPIWQSKDHHETFLNDFKPIFRD